MESRIMQVFYGVDCLPYKDSARKVHYPIVGNSFLGANNTTEIRFYVRDIGGVNNVSWVAVSKLPNGKVGSEVLSTIQFDSELHEYYVKLNLSSYYTQMKGDVYISLNGYQGEIQVSQDADTGIYTIEGTPIIEATGSIKLSINYAPQVPQGQHFNISDLQQILGAISEKTNIFSTIQIISDITQEDLSGYEDGQLFYDTYYNTYYQKNSLNETYGYVKAEDGLLANQHTILRLSGSEYGSFGTVKEIVHDRMFIFNYNSKDYLVSLNYGSFASGNNGVASALDLLSRQYYYRNDLTSSDNLSVLFQSQYETTYVDKAYVDNAIATIKRNAFISVDTTTYPTLQSFLNSTGEEGYIYLYPLDSQDLSKGYYQYTYENNAWLYLGETNLDLSGYATKEELEDYSTTSESQTYTQTYVATTLQSYDLTIKSWVNGKDYATNSQLNHNVHVEVQQHEFTFNGNTVTYTCSYVNLKTGTTGTRQENIPLANSTTAGMMSSSDYNQIRSNTDRISALEGRQFRLSYTASSNPTANDIKNFVNTYLASIGVTNPTDSDYFSISVVVEATKHIWNYYVNDHAYKDDGLDAVSIFTNNVAGIILGTDDNVSHTNDGKVYAENDGTGSVLGFDRLSTRVYNLENAGYITASVSNLQNYYDKTYIDTYIATKTWVGQQGYLTSLPSNVAYKDINNNFSTRQTISSASNDDTPLVLKGMYSNTSYIAYFHGDTYNGRIGMTSDGKAVIQSAYTGLTDKEIAIKDDTLKNAYHLGAFDSVDTSNSDYDLITRQVGYVDLGSLNWIYDGNGKYFYTNDLKANIQPPTNNFVKANIVCSIYGTETQDNVYTNISSSRGLDMKIAVQNDGLVMLINLNYTDATTFKGAMQGVLLQYQLSSSYTEKVIKNQPLNTLDQNGSEWLREEWEKGLNLLPNSANRTVQNQDVFFDVNIEAGKTYTFSIQGGTNSDAYSLWLDMNGQNVQTITTATGVQHSITFTAITNANRLGFYPNNISNANIMLNIGSTAQPYEDYNGKIIHEKDLETFESGENLFDISKLQGSYISVSGDTATITSGGHTSNEWTNILNQLDNGTYTITLISSYSGNMIMIGNDFVVGNTPYTFTKTGQLAGGWIESGATNSTFKVMLNKGSTPQPYKDYVGAIVRESTYAHYRHDLIINIQTSSNNTYFIRTSIITAKPTEYTTWEQVYAYLPSQLTSVGTSATQYTTAYLSNFTSSSLYVNGNSQSVVATNSITDVVTNL